MKRFVIVLIPIYTFDEVAIANDAGVITCAHPANDAELASEPGNEIASVSATELEDRGSLRPQPRGGNPMVPPFMAPENKKRRHVGRPYR
jgi:hypothetical protein